MARYGERWISLIELIESDPVGTLGRRAAGEFDRQLPYLLKVLAAERPLSIQAHPDASRAREGFERENRKGIAPDSRHRSYKDPNPKPECLCALTVFWGLKGFRPVADIAGDLALVCPVALKHVLERLEEPEASAALKSFFQALMNLPYRQRVRAVEEVVEKVGGFLSSDIRHQWIMRLYDAYPEDIGVLSPLFMNLVRLEPGQAMFLHPGELHAYLEGVGIELMANSDNVLRCGLTPKHIDVPELMSVLTFEGRDAAVIEKRPVGGGEFVFETPAREFRLSVIELHGNGKFRSRRERSVEILLCTRGGGTITDTSSRKAIRFRKGHSFMVPASVPGYTITGDAVLYRADLPPASIA